MRDDLKNETSRVCKTCGTEKPIDEFPFSCASLYRRRQCKLCYTKAQAPKAKNYYAENREKVLEKRKAVADERKRLGIKAPKRIRKDNDRYKSMKREANSRRNDALRIETFNAYGGCRCACCGETEMIFLSLDHINGGGNADRKQMGANGGHKFYRVLRDRGFPAGFQVLCMNCNIGKHRNGGVCPHKT